MLQNKHFTHSNLISVSSGWMTKVHTTYCNSSDIHCDSKVKDNTKDGTCKSWQKKWHYIIWGNLGNQGLLLLFFKSL